MDIFGVKTRQTSVRVIFSFLLLACACKEFSRTIIDKLKMLKLNTKPRAGPFIIETDRTLYVIKLVQADL